MCHCVWYKNPVLVGLLRQRERERESMTLVSCHRFATRPLDRLKLCAPLNKSMDKVSETQMCSALQSLQYWREKEQRRCSLCSSVSTGKCHKAPLYGIQYIVLVFTHAGQNFWLIAVNTLVKRGESDIWFTWYSSISDSLRDGWSGDRILVEARISAPVQAGPGGPSSLLYSGYCVIPGGKAAGTWH